MITFDDFQKIELKIGKILSAERVEGSEKLLKLSVDFAEFTEKEKEKEKNKEKDGGDGLEGNTERETVKTPRQVISGIAKQFPDPAILVGQKFTFITNLEPRNIMGLQSQAMILAATGPATDTAPAVLALLSPTADIPEGTKLS